MKSQGCHCQGQHRVSLLYGAAGLTVMYKGMTAAAPVRISDTRPLYIRRLSHRWALLTEKNPVGAFISGDEFIIASAGKSFIASG